MSPNHTLAQAVTAKRASLRKVEIVFSAIGVNVIIICALGWAFGLPALFNHLAFAIAAIGMAVGLTVNSVIDWLDKLEIPEPARLATAEIEVIEKLEQQSKTAAISPNGRKQVTA